MLAFVRSTRRAVPERLSISDHFRSLTATEMEWWMLARPRTAGPGSRRWTPTSAEHRRSSRSTARTTATPMPATSRWASATTATRMASPTSARLSITGPHQAAATGIHRLPGRRVFRPVRRTPASIRRSNGRFPSHHRSTLRPARMLERWAPAQRSTSPRPAV